MNVQRPKPILLLCCAVFILSVGIFLWSLGQWQRDWQLAHLAILPVMATKINMQEMITAIPNQHLFGQALSKINETPLSYEELELTGIVKIDHEEVGITSKATITVNGGASKIYQVGHILPNGCKVYAITKNSIILEKAGVLQQVPLLRKKLEFKIKNKIDTEDV